jgi:hypothetical protein
VLLRGAVLQRNVKCFIISPCFPADSPAAVAKPSASRQSTCATKVAAQIRVKPSAVSAKWTSPASIKR